MERPKPVYYDEETMALDQLWVCPHCDVELDADCVGDKCPVCLVELDEND